MDQKSFGGMEVVATDAETYPNVPSLAHPSNVIPFSKALRTKNKTKQTKQTQKLEPPISDDSTSGPVFEEDNSLLRNVNLNNRIVPQMPHQTV